MIYLRHCLNAGVPLIKPASPPDGESANLWGTTLKHPTLALAGTQQIHRNGDT